MSKSGVSFWQSQGKTILLAGFVAGTLDLLGAIIVYAILLKKITAEKLVRGIASGVFKKQAFSGGDRYGALWHCLPLPHSFCFYHILFSHISIPPFFKKIYNTKRITVWVFCLGSNESYHSASGIS
jgi:hypothetical protein